MPSLPDDPEDLVPHDLSQSESRVYVSRTVDALRDALIGNDDGGSLVMIDEVEAIGDRPDTRVIFRYHYRPQFVGRDPALVLGPLAEAAALWQFAIDPDDRWDTGLMDSPGVLAAAIGSAFDAAELDLVDPVSLEPIGTPPKIFPRLYRLDPPAGRTG